MDAEDTRGLVGLLLFLGAVYAYDIPLVDPGQGLGQLLPMCYHFWDSLST